MVPMENLPVHYVDSSAKLQTLVSEIAGHNIVGLDTEFISEGRYEPALCLVQLDQGATFDHLLTQRIVFFL